MKKLLLVESEMTRAKGHFLDYLIETSHFFKKNNEVIWFLNKNFNYENLYLPSFCKIKKIISSNKIKRKKNKFLYFIEEVFFFSKIYLIYFILFFIFLIKKNL